MKLNLVFLFLIIFLGLIFGQERKKIQAIHFVGNHVLSDGQLLNEISIREHSGLTRVLFWKEPMQLSSEQLKRDVRRLRRFYQTKGFLQVNIDSEIVSKSNEHIDIIFHITEGEPVLVQSLSFDFKTIDDFNKRVLQEKRANGDIQLSLTKGQRFQDRLLVSDKDRLIELYLNHGYPFVKINVETNIDSSKTRVQIIYKLNTGQRCVFGRILVDGNKHIPKNIIVKQMSLHPDQIFNNKLLQQSQQNIYQLSVFRVVTVQTQPQKQKENKIPVKVTVQEAPRLTTKFGLGYGREELFRTFVELKKIGLFGKARQLDIFIRHSALEPYHVNAKWTKPSFLYTRAKIVLNPFYRREKELGYTIDRIGGNIFYQQHFAKYTDGYIQYTLEQDKLAISQQTREEGLDNTDISLYNKSGFTFALTRDDSEPLFSPNQGMFSALTITISGIGFNSDFQYLRLLGEVRRYHQIYQNIIFAWRVKTGMMKAIMGDKITPIEERFYSGGSMSVRGWPRSKLGPQSRTGEPLGGQSLFESSAEVRYPIWKSLSGVIFLDTGNVWRTTLSYKPTELHYAAGMGLRYQTPIGPIRLDAGFPIFEGYKPIQLFLSVGQAF